MKYKRKTVFSLLSVLLLIAIFTGSAFALSGDGTNISHTGGGSYVSGAYLVPSSDADHHVGFRFTWLTKDASGNYTRKAALDVFYKGYNPNSSWGYHIKATVNGTTYRNLSKYEYKRWFNSVSIDREYYTDTNYKYCNRTSIPVTLPADEAAMTTWGKIDSNMNLILNKMVTGATVANMKAEDFVFIEPIYRVKIENTNYCITVTEMGLIGCIVCSNSSTGTEGEGWGSGWITIRRYTNYIWPDALKTAETHAGVAKGTTLSSSSYATFENMVKKGFGLMVVWNTSPHVLTVYYQTGTGNSSLKIGSGYKLASDYTNYTSSYIRNSANNYFTQTVNYDNNLTLMQGNSSGFNLTRDYYAFSKWKLDGTTTYYNGGASVKASALNSSVATSNQSATLVAVWAPVEYTITYNLNGGKIGTSSTSPTQKYTYETDLYIGNYSTGGTAYTEPTKAGNTFAGWKYTGNTVGYWTKNAVYANRYNKGLYEHGNITLTAQWTPVTYSVTYNANGGSGAPGAQTKSHGVNLTLSSTKPTRSGYTFNGWNTKADGTGVDYASGGTYTGNANLALYAKWTANKLTIAYDCYGSSPTITDTSKGFVLGAYNRLTTTSSSIAHKSISGTDNVYYQSFTYNNELGGSGLHDFATFGLSAPTGYRFTYWKSGDNNQLFDQSTTTYKPSDFTDEILTGDGQVWLTAQFAANTYSVKFNGNGATSGSMNNESFTYGIAKALTANAFSRVFTVTYNYNGNGSSNTTANATASFNGWATSASGGKVYNNQQSVSNLTASNGATVNLYAKWTDGSVTLPTPTRTGYTFTGWYTAATDGTKVGNGGASYAPSANIILYAHWRPNELTIAYDCNGSAVTITDASKGFTFGTYNRLCSTTQTNKTIAGTDHVYYQLFKYDNALGGTGLHDFATFGLAAPTGYRFSCWKNGSKTFDESTTTYKPTDFTDAILTGDTYIWLTAQFTPISYSVRFNGNSATAGSMSDESFTYGASKALTANAFSRAFTVTYNYNDNGSANTTANAAATFTGWATSANGSKIYNDRQSVSNLSSTDGAVVHLYAKWTDGSVILPSPTRTGYTLDGWYTAASGGTKVGNGGASYTVGANTTLYAHWTPIGYSVKFNGNGSTSGTMANQNFVYDTAQNLTANAYRREFTVTYNYNYSGAVNTAVTAVSTFRGWATAAANNAVFSDRQSVKNLTSSNGAVIDIYAKWTDISVTLLTPTRMGYTFDGWYTSANGGAKIGNGGASYTVSANITLYAHWSPDSFTVSYNANGGTGAPAAQTKPFGVDLTLSTAVPTRTGYNFKSWNTKADGTGTSYAPGDLYTKDESVILYATWTVKTYTVLYNANGGIGAPLMQIKTHGIPLILSSKIPTRTNYIFVAWNTKQDGTGKSYNPGQSYTDNSSVILYAQWCAAYDLRLEPVVPNAPYRSGTEVITSFYLLNSGTVPVIPDHNISVHIRIYSNGTLIKSASASAVVPGNEKNLYYVKWTVPNGIGSVTATADIVENGVATESVTRSYSVIPNEIYSTPDTQYEASAPEGFTVPTVPGDESQTKTWYVWSYQNGSFVKMNYGLAIGMSAPIITPDASANATYESGVWTMKSGYGFAIQANSTVTPLGGYSMPDQNAYTLPQYATALFPEFSYLAQQGKCRTLQLNGNTWSFRQNANYGNIHFTPLWFPDGNYTVVVKLSDCWTPLGMITRQTRTNTVVISGSAYDDWTIG